MSLAKKRVPTTQSSAESTPVVSSQPESTQDALLSQGAQVETQSEQASSEAVCVAPVGGVVPGPLDVSSEESSVEGGSDVAAEGAGEGGFFGWLGSAFGWGEDAADAKDFTGEYKPIEGNLDVSEHVKADTRFDEKSRLVRTDEETRDIDGGSETEKRSVEFTGKAKGDHEHYDIHSGLTGSKRITSTVEDETGRHVDSLEVSGKVEGGADRDHGETQSSYGSGQVGVSATQADTVTEGDTSTTLTTKESAKVSAGAKSDKDGQAAYDLGGEVGGSIEERTTTQAGDAKVVDTVGVGGKLGGKVTRKDGVTEAKANTELGVSASRATTTQQGDVTHVDTIGGDVKLKGELDKEKEGVRRMGSLQGNLRAEQKDTEKRDDGHTITTTHSQGLSGHGDLEREKDGSFKKSTGVRGTVGVKQDDSWTEDGVTTTDTRRFEGSTALERSAGNTTGSGGLKYGTDHKTVTTDEQGHKITDKSSDDYSVTADTKRFKDDKDKNEQGIGAGYQHRDTHTEEHTTEDGTKVKTSEEDLREIKGDYRQGKGLGVSLSTGNIDREEETLADGTKIVRHHEDKTTLSGDKAGVGLRHTVSGVSEEEKKKLGKDTTLTTSTGKVSGGAGVKVGKDKEGNWSATADADGKATLYEQRLQHKFGDGGLAEAGYEALSAEGKAAATASITKDGVKVGGNASAKATLIGGSARIEAPVFGWKMLGEEVDVAITAGVSAAVLAEANGNINLDVSKGEDLGAELSGGGKAFAGAKAGAEIGAKIRWKRQPDYTQLVKGFAKSLPGGFDDWLVDKVPNDVWGQVAQVLIGTGRSDLVAAKAGVEASAGIGGEAKFGLSLKGGKINATGALSGTVGLGAGVNTNILLDAIDGVRFIGVLAMRGTEWLKDAIAEAADWYDQAIDIVQDEIDEYMEAEKDEGGVSGAVATVVDFFGDSVFGLW